jgi:tRNA(fMet)-specific endonuclease VapC
VLVDTERQGGGVLEAVIGDDDDVAIAAVSVAELRVGVLLAEGERRRQREELVAAVLEAVAIEGYDVDVAEAHAALLAHVRRSGQPRGAHDLMIAATARARRREVVSSDTGGFADLPEVLLRGASSS